MTKAAAVRVTTWPNAAPRARKCGAASRASGSATARTYAARPSTRPYSTGAPSGCRPAVAHQQPDRDSDQRGRRHVRAGHARDRDPARPQRAHQARHDRRGAAEQQPRHPVHGARRQPAGHDADHLDREQAAAQRVHGRDHADVAGHVDELGVQRAMLGEVARRFDVHREVADGPRRHQEHPRDADADGQSDDEEAHDRVLRRQSPPTASAEFSRSAPQARCATIASGSPARSRQRAAGDRAAVDRVTAVVGVVAPEEAPEALRVALALGRDRDPFVVRIGERGRLGVAGG